MSSCENRGLLSVLIIPSFRTHLEVCDMSLLQCMLSLEGLPTKDL